MTAYDPEAVEFLIAMSAGGQFLTDDKNILIWKPEPAFLEPDRPERYRAVCWVCTDFDDTRHWMDALADAQAIGAFLARHQHQQSADPPWPSEDAATVRHFVDLLRDLTSFLRKYHPARSAREGRHGTP